MKWLKNKLPNIFLLLCLPLGLKAQDTTFKTTEYLDVNRFKAAHMVHGDMWCDLATDNASIEYPKSSGKHATTLAAIWMSGTDDSGKLHVAAQRYRGGTAPIGVTDYWPGPLNAADTLTYATSKAWARIWKINRSDISIFLVLASRTTGTVPPVILEWPAKGNPYAKGNAGASLVIDKDMAPFVDTDGDGLYDPLKGDYPDMKGDQMLWWIFSDNGAIHRVSKAPALKIECHMMAYAYNRGTKADQVLFYEYTLHNRSVMRYKDFRISIFCDADLGAYFDDYIAFDSVHRMGIEHNATLPDAVYGNHVPMTGLSLLEMPGDHYPRTMNAAGSFTFFENAMTGGLRDPDVGIAFNNYMHGKTYAGYPFFYYIGGTPHYGPYVYPLPDSSACVLKTGPGDRRFVLSSADYLFEAGTSTKLAMAFMATDTVGYACPVSSFSPITELADTAWDIYYHPLPLSMDDTHIAQQGIKLYPNPATGILYFETASVVNRQATTIQVYDISGRRMQLSFVPNGNVHSADISGLAPGVYSLVYDDGYNRYTQAFVKR